MTDEELAEIEAGVDQPTSNDGMKMSWLRKRIKYLIAEVRRQRAEIENLAGELRDEKAYAKELRDNMGQAGIY